MTIREIVIAKLEQSQRLLAQETDVFSSAVWRTRIDLCKEILLQDKLEKIKDKDKETTV